MSFHNTSATVFAMAVRSGSTPVTMRSGNPSLGRPAAPSIEIDTSDWSGMASIGRAGTGCSTNSITSAATNRSADTRIAFTLLPLVRKLEVNRQALVRVLRREGGQREIVQRIARRPIEHAAAARFFDADVRDPSVAQDGEHHRRRATFRLDALPVGIHPRLQQLQILVAAEFHALHLRV